MMAYAKIKMAAAVFVLVAGVGAGVAGCSHGTSVPKDARLVTSMPMGAVGNGTLRAGDGPGTFYIWDEVDDKVISATRSRDGTYNFDDGVRPIHAYRVYYLADAAATTRPTPR